MKRQTGGLDDTDILKQKSVEQGVAPATAVPTPAAEPVTVGKQTLNLPTIQYEIDLQDGILISVKLTPELISKIVFRTGLKCKFRESTGKTYIGGYPKYKNLNLIDIIPLYEEFIPQIKKILKDFCILKPM